MVRVASASSGASGASQMVMMTIYDDGGSRLANQARDNRMDSQHSSRYNNNNNNNNNNNKSNSQAESHGNRRRRGRRRARTGRGSPSSPPSPLQARTLNTRTGTLLFGVLATIVFVSHLNSCHSALLTNIYGGKKLSELTDFAHRFIIVPSTQLARPNNNNLDNNLQELGIQPAQQQQQQLQTQLDSPADAGGGSSSSSSSSSHLQPQVPPDGIVGASAEALTATTWKSTSQHQQPQQQRAKYYMLPSNGTSAGGSSASSGAMTAQAAAAAEATKTTGEPYENLSTEFPNPNINNLGHEITKILKKFFIHGYDKRVRPNYSGPPALVNVSFHIIGISSVDEVQMDFTTDFYFRQKWFDPRLEFNPVGEIDELCVGAEFAEKIWLPDTFFANEKTATFHKATTENTFIRIAHNGRVYRSIRLTVTCSCPMDLQYFPMDRQRCKIEIESYGYNTRDIDYRWERGDASVSLNTKIELPQFKILGFKMGQEIQNLSSGDYIRLYCEIHFVRSMGYYLIQIYIPASLIVMISWVSFWLHRNATPARVALGVTTVLTMTTLMSSTNAALPKISYIKSIDVFLGTCFVMVFASLLEYASVGYIGKRIAMKRKRLQDLQQMQQHHQKVCVAAAASAAAAAASAAANNTTTNSNLESSPQMGGANGAPNTRFGGSQVANKDSLIVTPLQVPMEGATNLDLMSPVMMTNGSQTLQRGRGPMKMQTTGGSKTLQRQRASNASGGLLDTPNNNEAQPVYGQRSAIKVMLDNNNNNQHQQHYHESDIKRPGLKKRLNPISPADHNNNHHHNNKNPLAVAGAALAAAAAANQTSHAATTEFEVTQTHDMIRICGLTPSAIDKHSRVVFPICFVCFNLMYWIIYGHISQQIEDKGPPLIPFIKG